MDSAKLTAAATGSDRAGWIYLNAQNGNLTMPAGTTSLDGTATSGAGLWGLLADTVTFGNNATLSASQPDSASGTLHGVFIAAETINYSGDLSLVGSGKGADAYNNGYVQLFPKGSNTITDSEDPLSLSIYGTIDFDQTGDITINGGGDITATANGDDTRVLINGTNITFNGEAVTLESKGNNDNHRVEIWNVSGTGHVTFSGTGNVKLDASGTDADGKGGVINFYLDQLTVEAPSFALHVDGPSSDNGDAGQIYWGTSGGFALDSGSHLIVTADGAPGGEGNGGEITMYPGYTSLTLTGSSKITANGGSGNGDAGEIHLIGLDDLELESSSLITAKALGDGEGGAIEIAYATSFTTGSSTISSAVHGEHGQGGTINIYGMGSIISTGTYVARGAGDDKGGDIALDSYGDIDTKLATLSADGGCDAGDGGTVNITGVEVAFGNMRVTATNSSCAAFSAKLLSGTGNGGSITINALTVPDAVWSNLSDINLNAIGTGKGGTLEINNTNGVDLTDLSDDVIKAKGGDDGEGGKVTIDVVTTFASDLLESLIDVKGGDSIGETDDGGQLGVNSVLCQRRLTPTAYAGPVDSWDCTVGTNYPLVSTVLNSATSYTKTDLNNANFYLYGFADQAAAINFLGASRVSTPGVAHLGFTRHLSTGKVRHYSVVYTSGNSTGQIEGAIRHEASHQYDHYHSTVSETAYFKALVAQDWALFDAIPTCTLWPVTPVCVSGVVQAPYAGRQNHEILNGDVGIRGIPGTFKPTAGNEWNEIFTEHLAILSGGGYDTTIDPWLSGYFPCSKHYVNHINNNGFSSTVTGWPTGCSSPGPQP